MQQAQGILGLMQRARTHGRRGPRSEIIVFKDREGCEKSTVPLVQRPERDGKRLAHALLFRPQRLQRLLLPAQSLQERTGRPSRLIGQPGRDDHQRQRKVAHLLRQAGQLGSLFGRPLLTQEVSK